MNFNFLPLSLLLMTSLAFAGGTPDLVSFPAEYKKNWVQYDFRNRLGQHQAAKLYANKALLDAIRSSGGPAHGSKVVLEVYSPQLSAEEKPLKDKNGIYKIDQLKAIQVMEMRDDWPAELGNDNRSGNWAFAMFAPDGKPLQNDLDCASCHTPLIKIYHLFSIMQLREHVHPQTTVTE